jgi:hypothetical protein
MGVELGWSLSGSTGNLVKGRGLFIGNGSIFQEVRPEDKMTANL